jgi:DNA-binding CsgD family transcriptional regulator
VSLSNNDQARVVSIAARRLGLSPKETDVATKLALTEESLDQIAFALGNSVHTVRTHVRRCFRKADARSRTDFVRRLFVVGGTLPDS